MDKQRKEKKDKKEKEKSYIQGSQKGRLLLQTAPHSPKVLIPTFKNRDVPFWKGTLKVGKGTFPSPKRDARPGHYRRMTRKSQKGQDLGTPFPKRDTKKGPTENPNPRSNNPDRS